MTTRASSQGGIGLPPHSSTTLFIHPTNEIDWALDLLIANWKKVRKVGGWGQRRAYRGERGVQGVRQKGHAEK